MRRYFGEPITVRIKKPPSSSSSTTKRIRKPTAQSGKTTVRIAKPTGELSAERRAFLRQRGSGERAQTVYLDSSEWAIVDSRAATATEEQVQQCAATTNYFIDYMEQQGTAGLPEKSFELFGELKTKMDAGAPQQEQLEIMYALAKEEVFYEVTDCILTILAYEKAKQMGLHDAPPPIDIDTIATQPMSVAPAPQVLPTDVAATMEDKEKKDKLKFYGMAGGATLLIGGAIWFAFIREPA